MRGAKFTVAAAMLCGSNVAAADQSPICADRPGKATSACTVPDGRWQVETDLADWTLQKEAGERDTSLLIGETTVKYGITRSSDLELDVTAWQRATASGPGFHESATGFGDINVVYKQRLSSADAPVQLIVMPFVKAPTAKRSLGNGKWEGGVLFPISYSVPKTPLSIGATPELDWAADSDGHGHHAATTQVVDVGWLASSKINLSAEIWGSWDWDPAGTTRQYSADGSIAYLVNNNLQLDAGANFGLNHDTPDVELYTGVSVRF